MNVHCFALATPKDWRSGAVTRAQRSASVVSVVSAPVFFGSSGGVFSVTSEWVPPSAGSINLKRAIVSPSGRVSFSCPASTGSQGPVVSVVTTASAARFGVVAHFPASISALTPISRAAASISGTVAGPGCPRVCAEATRIVVGLMSGVGTLPAAFE